jgi:hypothetical protein
MPQAVLDVGFGPRGIQLGVGQPVTWSFQVPLGLTSFWTVQPLNNLATVEETRVYHDSDDVGIKRLYVEVLNRGDRPADYILLYAYAQARF